MQGFLIASHILSAYQVNIFFKMIRPYPMHVAFAAAVSTYKVIEAPAVKKLDPHSWVVCERSQSATLLHTLTNIRRGCETGNNR